MLTPDDRAVLREQLQPDPGFELDLAVTTTFTLDLTAALVAPLAFAAHEVSRGRDPIAVLESVRNVTDRMDIFCQVGQIRVPATASDLMAFLEPMVHEVQPPRTGFLFHPKVWVVRYLDPEGEPAFRLLCGTRNLTDDVSWDAVVCLDGRLAGARPRAGNRPLFDFVRSLPGLAVRKISAERRARIEALAEDLRRVRWDLPEDVREINFHALGLRDARTRPQLLGVLEGRRHLVVAPFLDDDGVAAATASTDRATLVSRPEALERLKGKTLEGIDCRIVSSLAGLEQPDEDDVAGETEGEGASSLLGGLHAKIYVVEAGRQVRMILGSANATQAGLHSGNVEFLVEMLGKWKAMGIEQLLESEAGFGTILEPYPATGDQSEPQEEVIGRELERHLRRVAGRTFTARVRRKSGTWEERVTSKGRLDLPQEVDLAVGLLTVAGKRTRPEDGVIDATFADLAMADITPFIVLELTLRDGALEVRRSAVIRARLEGDPPERWDYVIARQVDSPEKFLRFVALLLGLLDGSMASVTEGGTGAGQWFFGPAGQTGLFELLVRSIADRPEAIADLTRLVERLEATEEGRAVLPEGFLELWVHVRRAHERVVSR